jgi:hypothetical protein
MPEMLCASKMPYSGDKLRLYPLSIRQSELSCAPSDFDGFQSRPELLSLVAGQRDER